MRLRCLSKIKGDSIISEYDSKGQNEKSYESDLIVVLDMDEYLIHSKFLSLPAAAQVYAHQLRRQNNNNANNNSNKQQTNGIVTSAVASSGTKKSALVDSFRVTLLDGDLVHVHVRPVLQDFWSK